MKKILIVTIFSFLFINKIPLYSDIKLRFKEIKVEFKPVKKSNTEFASKIVNYLYKEIKKGDLNRYFMTITIKKYDVIVRKEKIEKDLVKIFKKENKIYIHKVSLLVEVNDEFENEVDSIPIKAQTELIVDENLTFNQRKTVNKNLYNELEAKLIHELKKKFLTRLGDFVIPN